MIDVAEKYAAAEHNFQHRNDSLKGFKQTEFGNIPDDWSFVTLNSITTLMTNGFVGTATHHYVENETGVLYIQGYNVKENSFNFHGVKYVTHEFHKLHMKSCLREEDVLTIQTGDVGLTTVVNKNTADANCHALIISRFDKSKALPLFISYYFNSPNGRSRLRLIETGTTMKHINVGDLLRFSVPLPAQILEQQAIAEALSDADALIEGLEKLIAKKRLIKQGAMQELLTGNRRLPGFSGEWDMRTLGEICTFENGDRGVNYPSRSQFTDSGFPFVNAGHLTDGIIQFDEMDYIKQEQFDRLRGGKFRHGDILFCLRGSLGKFGVVELNMPEGVIASSLIIVRPIKNLIDPEYLQCYFKSELCSHMIDVWAGGAAQPNLGGREFGRFSISLPQCIEEQQSIASFLSEMNAEISSIEAKLSKARLIKQGMMQELLTGRIRLI